MTAKHEKRKAHAALFGILAAVLLAACRPEPDGQLPAISAEPGQITVSGVSSGAYMAGQYQFAHARTVTGAAIVAGGPYGCAESLIAPTLPAGSAAFLNMTKAANVCMLDGLRLIGEPDPNRLADAARKRAAAGEIDPVSHVRNDRVYLFAGSGDHTVVPEIVAAAARFYETVGVAADRMTFVRHPLAGHGILTETIGVACGSTGRPYLNDCDHDQAGAILDALLGDLAPPSPNPEIAGDLIAFDQRPFLDPSTSHGMALAGYAYVPHVCRGEEGCRIHIAFHGCNQNAEKVGEVFVRDAGFNRWAASNRIVVLYPQTTTTALNANACWDWWGYTGADFLTRSAPQIRAVNAMVRMLASDPSSGRRPPQVVAVAR
ncbi:MAG: poly(3-hydroxybutyrate) depolymerase [Rhizobiales bacterium]|nr:poly(3-hydroxybutyrate) depolymerase [Hyphomicrobiales bacterium]